MTEQKKCEKCGRPSYWGTDELPFCKEHLAETVVVAYVRHSYYGCDSGCCGTGLCGVDKNGRLVVDEFEFDHPETFEDIEARVENYFGRKVKIDKERCDLGYGHC